jgi:PBSX family phage terminase large subunit
MVAEPLSVEPEFAIKGNVKRVLTCTDKYVLYDGPRGTGKTRPICEKLVMYARSCQGTRILIMRKTRASMSQTTLVTLEKVLARLYPKALTQCTREHVRSYWVGASEIVVSGCDMESRQRSGEYAVVWFDEAHEITVDDWELLSASLRWHPRWYPQIIATSNPDADTHFLWQKFKEGKLTRIQSKHEDNPAVTEEYLDTLRNLSGVRRQRYYEGIWTSAEGQVLESWNPEENMIDCPETADGKPDYGALHISWFFATMDWGHSAAGCMDIWGATLDDGIVLVKEQYQTKRTGGWWCDRLVEFNDQFHLRAIACDPSRPDMIADFNTRLGYLPEHPDSIAWGANNRRGSTGVGDLSGVNLLCEMVAQRKLRVLRDYQGEIDEQLRLAGLPTCSHEEVAGWIWLKTKDGRYLKDTTDPKVPDHGMDNWRYACSFARDRDLSDPPIIPKDDPESYGALYHHNALVAALKVAEEECVPFDDVYQEILDEQLGV